MKIAKSHQIEAIQKGVAHFSDYDRGLLAMACGSGKTLVSLLIAKKMNAQTILVALPKLNLQSQTAKVWLEELRDAELDILCVGSDKGVAPNENTVVTTDYSEIERFLLKPGKKVIITTYQSTIKLKIACESTNTVFDFGIIDEAHRTAGDPKKAFSSVIFDDYIPIEKRLFMTATPLNFDDEEMLSMDNPDYFGKCFHSLSLSEAIEKGILSDYKIIVSFVEIDEKRIQKVLKPKNTPAGVGIALKKAIEKYSLKRVLTFHKNIKTAIAFQDLMINEMGLNCQHINHKSDINQRRKIIESFIQDDVGIITNVKIMAEGIDVPQIDGVVFGDLVNSFVDVLQIIGRALRKHQGKDMAYILLPVFIYPDKDGEVKFINESDLNKIRFALSAVSITDSRVKREVENMAQNTPSEKTMIQYEGIKLKINPLAYTLKELNEVSEKLNLRVWQRMKRENWLSYEEAKIIALDVAKNFGIDSRRKWQRWATGTLENTPKYNKRIPTNPNDYYFGKGWETWESFFGKEPDKSRFFLKEVSKAHRDAKAVSVKGMTRQEIETKYNVSRVTSFRALKRGIIYINYHKKQAL